MSAARLAARGRRAGQMCSVEICPCRTFFSWTESSEVCFKGKATSIRRGSSIIMGNACLVVLLAQKQQFLPCGRERSLPVDEHKLLVYHGEDHREGTFLDPQILLSLVFPFHPYYPCHSLRFELEDLGRLHSGSC